MKRIYEQINNVIENCIQPLLPILLQTAWNHRPYPKKIRWEPLSLIVIRFLYGSKGRGVFDIAYLGWRIREELKGIEQKMTFLA